jgi:hypothetical protein
MTRGGTHQEDGEAAVVGISVRRWGSSRQDASNGTGCGQHRWRGVPEVDNRSQVRKREKGAAMASCGNAACAREEERGEGPDLVHHAEGKEGGGRCTSIHSSRGAGGRQRPTPVEAGGGWSRQGRVVGSLVRGEIGDAWAAVWRSRAGGSRLALKE